MTSLWHTYLEFLQKIISSGKTEQGGDVCGGPYSSLAEDSISLCIGCPGLQVWCYKLSRWSQGEAQWSLLLSGDLVMRLAECPARGKPPRGGGLGPGSSTVSQVGSSGSRSPRTELGPSCSLPMALPGDLCLGCADSAPSPNPGSQTWQWWDLLRTSIKWAPFLQLVCTNKMVPSIFFQSVSKSKVYNTTWKGKCHPTGNLVLIAAAQSQYP